MICCLTLQSQVIYNFDAGIQVSIMNSQVKNNVLRFIESSKERARVQTFSVSQLRLPGEFYSKECNLFLL